MSNINRAPGGKGAIADTSRLDDTMVHEAVAETRGKIGILYDKLEKPVEQLVDKVEGKLPDNYKGYSGMITSLLSVMSFSLFILGIYGMIKLFRQDTIEFIGTE